MLQRERMKPVVPTLIVLCFALASAPARADVPRDDETKSVPYTFTVHGIDGVAADTAVFSSPCASGDGPLLREGSVVSGFYRGSETCAIYRISKSSYDAWRTAPTSIAPTAVPAGAVKCTGGPSPLTELDADDSRTSINEDLDVTVDATSCSVVSRGAPQRSSGGCSANGRSSRAPLALLLGLPAMFILLLKKRRPVAR